MILDTPQDAGERQSCGLLGRVQRVPGMRSKAIFFLNKNTDETTKETYGFKSKRSPPQVKELNEFEDCMLDMIQRVEFKTNTHPNDLRKKLSKDVKEIRESRQNDKLLQD